MRINVGSADRVVRLILGVILIAAPFLSGLSLFASPLPFWGAVVVGAVLVLTAAVRFCPLYTIFGLSTCKVSPR